MAAQKQAEVQASKPEMSYPQAVITALLITFAVIGTIGFVIEMILLAL